MDGIITQEEEFAIAALFAGSAAITVNVLPFFIKVIVDINKATKDDDFNIFKSVLWLYIIQYLVSIIFCYLVDGYELFNEAGEWVKLTGDDGVFYLFWNSDINTLLSNAISSNQSELANTYFTIKWIREIFTIVISLLFITLLFLGYKGGYKHTYAMQQKTNSETEWFTRFIMGFVGLFLIGILMAAYNFITMESYFMGKTILELIQDWYNKVLF